MPDIEDMVDDIAFKAQQLQFDGDLPAALKEDELFAVVAYTYDSNSGEQKGQIYFELNNALRERDAAARKATTALWSSYLWYLFSGLDKLPAFKGPVFRAYTAGTKAKTIADYGLGRPVQWGAFSSTSTSFDVAAGFVGAMVRPQMFFLSPLANIAGAANHLGQFR